MSFDLPTYHKQQASELAKSQQTLKATLLELAKTKKVAKVHVTYDGSGDSGQIEEITFMDKGGRVILIEDSITDKLDTVICGILPGGWELDSGSLGTIDIVIKGKTVKYTHEHNERYEEVNTTTNEVEM